MIRRVSLLALLLTLGFLALPAHAAGERCGAGSGDTCGADEFCKLRRGDCGQSGAAGVCTPIPEACTLQYDPVCGCDGETYGNECEADRAGVSIQHEGECEAQVCGGIQGLPCDEDEFCLFPDGSCLVADAAGVCVSVPLGCPDVVDPVCGCDGVTYGNRCEAIAAGAQIAHQGECPPRVCGGIAGVPCDEGEFCKLPPGECETADLQGVCQPIPEACPLFYDPVCGCDGRTYGNECEADRAGVQIDHDGPCERVCGGIQGLPCDEGEFCAYPDGTCDIADREGVCRAIPLGCPDVWDPVCGCDGLTYSNRCDAAAAGVSVDHPGECLPPVCGGIAGVPCDEGEFCKLPPGECETADLQGICQPIPEACPLIYDPVCGCDGQTYGNACEADQAGVQIDREGPCERVCGGIQGLPCDEDEFCKLPRGLCNVADLEGICEPTPEVCPEIYDPVCGCDGETYDNECFADQAGAQIAHSGVCPQVCGGIAGIPCENPDEYCVFPDGTCDVADNQGVCHPIPDACPDVWDPVCGCDGRTYGNRCEAAAAQAQIAAEGPCEQVCGGIAGIPCDDPDEFCLFPVGTCHFGDPLGRCVPIPESCPEVCHPVCGCDGETYGNECLSRQAGVSLASHGPCDPEQLLIRGVRFDSPTRMRWLPAPGARAYNVYREVHLLPPPVSAGECYESGLDEPGTVIVPDPDPGEVWLLQVTGVFESGEGPMGISSNCESRAPDARCGKQ